VRPSPSLDFNGARFLYFASFAALVDRAEWEILQPSPLLTTAAREVIYYGNIEPGDEVIIRINKYNQTDTSLGHWSTLVRRCDDAMLADIFTSKIA
jgi:probable biosynthetic protein (TIGR04099 family)